MVELLTHKQHCEYCYGNGKISACCDVEFDNGKCLGCGKFCKSQPCNSCDGSGYIIYNVGDEVNIYISIYSDKYLHKIYKPKNKYDLKLLDGVIEKFIDKWNLVVKINNKSYILKYCDITK